MGIVFSELLLDRQTFCNAHLQLVSGKLLQFSLVFVFVVVPTAHIVYLVDHIHCGCEWNVERRKHGVSL